MRATRFLIALGVAAFVSGSAYGQSDVTQPGDPIIPSSANSPGSEAVANAIDNQPTKYLNFDSGRDGTNAGFSPSGFVVSPSVGLTRITGLSMQSANDAPNRDPKTVTLEGSLDATITNFNSGTWQVITVISNITPWTTLFPGNDRFQKQTFFFPNPRAYRHYRWVVTETQTTPNGCCLQIAEVEFLGTTLPLDVTQPGDQIVPSSANSPGSEAVANAIDNQPTKYLNFDSGRDGTNAGFSPSGFAVRPSIGRTLVTGIAMQSANDAPNRDPKAITLEGSNDAGLTNFTSGTWELITAISNITPWTTLFPGADRFKSQIFFFDNFKPYRQYRWVVNETQTTPNGCCLQIAEVELLGTTAPVDVTQPGDFIVPSSANSPGSEAVANAIDNQPTKYLNFDSGRDGTNAGFSPSGFAVTPGVGPTRVIGLTMQSANDAPNRDPKWVTLEGSNDSGLTNFNSGTWQLITEITNITPWTTLFPGADRFKVQEFFFSNSVAYKHYRWTVKETQTTPNGCCLQIAEVEFLAVPQGGNTNLIETLIRRQPEDAPVLVGAQATFRVFLTGPWLVQWYRNDVAIPGATLANYTTPSIVATNDGDRYYAVVQSAQGTQKSDQVLLNVFTPSAIESIGVSWQGAGANGAPTPILPVDITGFHKQAYWNNMSGGSASLVGATNSSNVPHPTITVTWATSGEWGVGTGNGSPTERLLNGMDTTDSTASNTAHLVTFSGVPAGTHSLLIYTVQVPLEFFNMNFQVITHDGGGAEIIQERFIRPQNSDEYNPSPGFILVTSTQATNRTVGNMMRFDNLQPGPDGIILVRFWSPGRASLGGEPIRGPGVNGMQLLLNPGPVPEAPVITQQPVSKNGTVGGQVALSVAASGPNLTYQWLRNGQAIQGATNVQLVLFNLDTNDIARYSVAVANAAGRVVSRAAFVDVLATEQITEDLILYYRFNDEGGPINNATMTDYSGRGVHGGVRGNTAPDWPPGIEGGALNFDGLAYGVTENYPKPSAALTVSGWVFPLGSFGPLINNWVGTNTIGRRGQFQLDLSSLNELTARIGAGANVPIVSSFVDTSAAWHHFALSANGSTLTLYWDGVAVSTTDYLGTINNAPPSVPFTWLAVGADLPMDTNAPTRLFAGQMDDIALFSRSLSDEEVLAVYNAGIAGFSLAEVPPVITASPRLDIFRPATNVVTISWRSDFQGFVLKNTPTIINPVWTTVPGVVSNRVSITNPAGTAFFRLEK